MEKALFVLRDLYEDRARDCTACALHTTRKNVVFGIGNFLEPDIAFLGEAPGEEEDLTGYPFQGASGKLLTKMIEAMGTHTLHTYILNTVMCRPPGNRVPTVAELAACAPFMVEQLEAVKPKTVVCLGATATRALLGVNKPLAEMRGKWHEWRGVPVRVTFHPAYLLRCPGMKPEAWKDLKAFMAKLSGSP